MFFTKQRFPVSFLLLCYAAQKSVSVLIFAQLLSEFVPNKWFYTVRLLYINAVSQIWPVAYTVM